MDEKKKITALISDYLEKNTIKPAISSIEDDVKIAVRLGDSAYIVAFLEMNIASGYDVHRDMLQQEVEEIEENLACLNFKDEEISDDLETLGRIMESTCTKKCLAPYINKQLNWILVTILSTNYICSYIVMRSVLEFIINLSSTDSGGMKKKIDSIPFYSVEEKSTIKNLWDELNAWAHPYKKWEKNICPHFISHSPLYHPAYFEECVKSYESLLDIYLILTIELFKVDIDYFSKCAKERYIQLQYFYHINKRIFSRNAV